MRICHVLEAAGGGSGQVVIDLVRAGLANGDDVSLVYAPNRAEPTFVETVASITGLKVICTKMRHAVGAHDMLDAWRLYRHLRRAGPFDVIHGHSSKAGALVRLTGVALPRARKIYTPHGFITMDLNASPIYGYIERILSWLCDAVIVVSNYEREHAIRRIGISRRKVIVIPNGINDARGSNRTAARRELGYEDDAFVLGFVGRLVPQKDPLRLIDSFAIASKQQPNLNLAVIGDGPLRAEVENLAAQRGLANKMRCFGRKSGRTVMAGFDGLCCSSNYEGFPLIFLEALAAGVPIVTTPVGGAHECVVEGKTGFIAQNFSSESLAQAMLKLTTLKSSTRTCMADHSRRHVQRFTGEAISATTWALYRSVARSEAAFLET
jgi:glycosyltransferase involved in cell wall biosynthesis